MPIRVAVAAFVAAIGVDLLGHLLSQPVLEEAGHLATLSAMVAVLFAIVTSAHRPHPPSQPQGDRHAVR
jgi:uncharacterized membrane protein